MTDPRENYPMTREERIKEDYYYMEKQERDWEELKNHPLDYAADLARKEARKVKANKLIKFLRRPENA